MSDLNAYATRTNTHQLTADRQHLACAPTKPLPKGEAFLTGREFNADGTKTGLRQVVCHRCNRVNWNR